MHATKQMLDNWLNGNFSQLDRVELICIARYFEDKANGIKFPLMDTELG